MNMKDKTTVFGTVFGQIIVAAIKLTAYVLAILALLKYLRA